MDNPDDMRAFEGAVIAGRYRLDRFLDEGAFGAVYRASHLAYGVELREVAIKVAKRRMTDLEAQQVFKDALMMARLTDKVPDAALRDHFVGVYDAGRSPEGGTLAGHPYVVMELVSGGSLKGCLRAGPFPLTRAVAYFDQVLTAMSFMHGGIRNINGPQRAITHRDLKPSNILVLRHEDAPDVVKIADFGLAVEVDTLMGWVESGGDLAYLAPESFSHDISSPQSDVYMMGLVFYEMLIGQNPFSEVGNHLHGAEDWERTELRRLHLVARQMEQFGRLDSHEEIRQRPALGRVIRTALQPDMSARIYRNASEFMSAWEQAKVGEDPRQPVERPWERVRLLTGEAEQCFAVGEAERGEWLLGQAMKINRDRSQVPDSMIVGLTYLLTVRQLLNGGRIDEAGRLANEGYQRRRCRSMCLAMHHYYSSLNSPIAGELRKQADQCADRE